MTPSLFQSAKEIQEEKEKAQKRKEEKEEETSQVVVFLSCNYSIKYKVAGSTSRDYLVRPTVCEWGRRTSRTNGRTSPTNEAASLLLMTALHLLMVEPEIWILFLILAVIKVIIKGMIHDSCKAYAQIL